MASRIFNLITARDRSLKQRIFRFAIVISMCFFLQTACSKKPRKIKDKELLKQEWTLEGTNGKAILFIHGINGLPIHMLPFAQTANKAGYTSRVILLPGHGGRHKDLKRATAEQWQTKVEKEYDKLASNYDEVTVVGFSLGSALTLQLCQNRDVKRAVVISPPIKLWTEKFLTSKFIRKSSSIIRWVPVFKNYGVVEYNGEERRVPVNNNGWVHSKAVMQGDKIISDITPKLSSIKTKMLLIHAKNDLVLDSKSSQIVYDNIDNKESKLVYVDSREHSMFLIDKRKEVMQAFTEFINNEETK